MYRTCLFCNRSLGENEIVGSFPVGRRLAFDPERGRLWVICESCRRWNLSPLEERWEAVEECERGFRGTRLRYSTENIGLARLGGGVDLVRIGRPQRPEFAAWRYGRQFLRRRVRRVVRATAQAVGYTMTSFLGILFFYFTDENSKVVARVRDDAGRRLTIARRDLKQLELLEGDAPGAWSLVVPYRGEERGRLFRGARARGALELAQLTGPSALRAAAQILPRINTFGGTRTEVRDAVRLIETAGAPERLFGAAPRLVRQTRFTRMDQETRLALEMAAHEETERRAMEGELAELEAAWREAEEIAAIADRLLIPESIESWIRRERRASRAPKKR